MCGCRSGTGHRRAAGATSAAGAGEAAAFGPAAAAGKASVKRSVAMMSSVKNPIFFKYSSSSEFRLGRNHSEFTRLLRKFSRFALLDLQRGGPATPAQYNLSFKTGLCKGYFSDALRIRATFSPPQKRRYQQHHNRRRHVEPFYVPLQPFPMLPEEIARAGNHRHP